MKTFFEEYGLSVILGCIVCLLVVMCSPVGTAVKGGLDSSTEGVKNTGTEVQAKAAKSVKSLAGEEEEIPDTIFVGYNSQNQCLVFSHDENSELYSNCNNKYGDCKDRKNNDLYSNPLPWHSFCYSISEIIIENKIKPTDMSGWFSYSKKITGLENINTKNVTNMNTTFARTSISSLDLSGWDLSNLTKMNQMFYNSSEIQSINLSNTKSNSLTNMRSTFDGCYNLRELNLTNFKTENVTSMEQTFLSCSSLTSLNLSSFDTRKVDNFTNMFAGCGSLTTIVYGENFVKKEGATTRNMFGFSGSIIPANKPSWW